MGFTHVIGLITSAFLFFICSLLAGEFATLPTQTVMWLWLVYLILLDSCAVFILFSFILKRRAVSATAYSFILFPIVNVAASTWLTGETISSGLLVGASLVLGLCTWDLSLLPKNPRLHQRPIHLTGI